MARKAAAPESKLSDEAQRIAAEAAHRIEAAVQEGLAKLRAQSKVYAETATEQLDEAQKYAAERIRERPLASAGVALGVGVVIGLLLAGGRR
jgi:ElaB/YqjD/DUF883 family membrane-anchored ribosome-binding protein